MEDNEVCVEQFFDLSLLHPTENAYEILELSIYQSMPQSIAMWKLNHMLFR